VGLTEGEESLYAFLDSYVVEAEHIVLGVFTVFLLELGDGVEFGVQC
jgi:hypothetical protein